MQEIYKYRKIFKIRDMQIQLSNRTKMKQRLKRFKNPLIIAIIVAIIGGLVAEMMVGGITSLIEVIIVAPTLIKNGDFETGTLEYWQVSTSNGRVLSDPTTWLHGSYSATIIPYSDPSDSVGAILTQLVSLKKGKNYYLSIWAKSSLQQQDQFGLYVSYPSNEKDVLPTEIQEQYLTTSWQEYSNTFTAADQEAEIQMFFWLSGILRGT